MGIGEEARRVATIRKRNDARAPASLSSLRERGAEADLGRGIFGQRHRARARAAGQTALVTAAAVAVAGAAVSAVATLGRALGALAFRQADLVGVAGLRCRAVLGDEHPREESNADGFVGAGAVVAAFDGAVAARLGDVAKAFGFLAAIQAGL